MVFVLFLPEFLACPRIKKCLVSALFLLHEDPDSNGNDELELLWT